MRLKLLINLLFAITTIYVGMFTVAHMHVQASSPTTTPPATTTPATSNGVGIGLPIPCVGTGCTAKDNPNFNEYVEEVYKFSIRLGGLLTILMLIFAGYKYMTSQGNPTAINEAKDILFGSLSGFGLLLLIYFVLNIMGIPH